MIKLTALFAALATLGTTAAVDDQAFFAILVETKVGRLAGMPPIDLSQLPPGMKLPKEAMMFSGRAVRLVNMRLWSPSIAPSDAKASVEPPAGLKQGSRLDLDLYRPEGRAGTEKVQGFDPDSDPEKFTIKIYWGSSTTVREGQPKVITWNGLTPEQKAAMKDRAREARADAASYFYKEGWTTGYWPTSRQSGDIAKDASLVGTYKLTTNYTGNVEIEAPSQVEFLDPIMISAPNLDKKIDLKKAIQLEWAKIPNALGLSASIIAMEGKNTLIIWTASEVYTDGAMGDNGFLQMAEVRERVAQKVFMEGSRTNVDVPAGIFQNADFAMMNMAGYGPGSALEKAQPLPRIQTKTTLMLMLGGKKMPG